MSPISQGNRGHLSIINYQLIDNLRLEARTDARICLQL
jgi:hypothetical protein